MSTRVVLAALVAVRIAIPLAALAASGQKLPAIPRYDFVALTGDASGFYAATREFLASWGRLGVPLVALLGLAAIAVAAGLAWAWRRRRLAPHWILVLGALAFALLVAAAVTQMQPSGAAVFGWPLLWSLPMLPYRALGGPLDPEIAYGFALPLSLAANAATVVATYFVGLYATGRRQVGLAAAALFAFLPLLTGLLPGDRAWRNGTWTVDAGLVLYTEPVSTALVTTSMALLLSPRLTPFRLALAGVAVSLATAVKLTNALVAALALALLALRLRRGALPYLAGAVTFAPLVLAFWPRGYASLFDNPNSWPRDPFSPDYVVSTWTDSLLFRPALALTLLVLAVAGSLALRNSGHRALLLAWALVNPVFYSFYRVAWEHPRFMFASVPAVLALASAAPLLVAALRDRRVAAVRSS